MKRCGVCPYVHPSVCLSQHGSQQQTLLLWARPAENIDRLLHGAQQHGVRRANVVWCGMSEICLKLKVLAKIDFIVFLACLGVK